MHFEPRTSAQGRPLRGRIDASAAARQGRDVRCELKPVAGTHGRAPRRDRRDPDRAQPWPRSRCLRSRGAPASRTRRSSVADPARVPLAASSQLYLRRCGSCHGRGAEIRRSLSADLISEAREGRQASGKKTALVRTTGTVPVPPASAADVPATAWFAGSGAPTTCEPWTCAWSVRIRPADGFGACLCLGARPSRRDLATLHRPRLHAGCRRSRSQTLHLILTQFPTSP